MNSALDHLVIGAETLEQGVDFIRELLGVEIPFGGVHSSIGTHNHLMQLGGEVFLEVIAINPASEPTIQPRWYGLDDPFVRAQIGKQPTLLTWVVNTDNLPGLLDSTSTDFGVCTPVTRGQLSWLFGLPHDGRLLAAGMLPYLIEWKSSVHPSANMADCDCRLVGIEISHPNPEWLVAQLTLVGADKLVSVTDAGPSGAPSISVRINSPKGLRTLNSISV